MNIIGVDPGIGTTGFGVVSRRSLNSFSFVECGCLTTLPGLPLQDRLLTLSRDFGDLLDRLKPEQAAVEKLFFGNNVTTAFAVGQARGVLLLEIARRGIPMAEYSPPQVKQAVAGYGAASKAQIQAMVSRLLGLAKPPTPDDAADGLALALCHGFASRYLSLTAGAKAALVAAQATASPARGRPRPRKKSPAPVS